MDLLLCLMSSEALVKIMEQYRRMDFALGV